MKRSIPRVLCAAAGVTGDFMISNKPQQGISLIESLISLLVLSLGVVSAVRIQSIILDAHCIAKHNALAASLIDQIRSAVVAADTCPSSRTQTSGNVTVTASLVNTPNVSLYCQYNFTVTNNRCITTQNWSLNNIRIPRSRMYVGGGSSGGAGIEIPDPAIARRINEAAVSTPVGTNQSSPTDNEIGIRITRDNTTGEFRLYREVGTNSWKEAIRSTAAFIRISGVVASTNATIFSLRSTSGNKPPGMTIITTGVGQCEFPLSYSNANDVSTYRKTAPPADAKAAAYVCYVPEGWAGNVAIDFSNWPNQTHACPDLSPNNPQDLRGGWRSHKTIYSDTIPPTSENQITGQTGVRVGDEPLLQNLHFLIYENNQQQRCNTVVFGSGGAGVTVSDAATPAVTFRSQGYGGLQQFENIVGTGVNAGLEGITCRTKDTCLKPSDYWIRIDRTGTLTGTLQRLAGSSFNWSNISLTVSSSSGSRACVLEPVDNNTRRFVCLASLPGTSMLAVSSSSGSVIIHSATPSQPYQPPVTGITITVRDAPP